MRKSIALAALVAGGLCGCPSGTALQTTTAPASTASPVTGEEDVYPIVLVHGLSGDNASWRQILDGLESGRTVFRDAYADDLAALPAGSVSRSSAFAVGYYRRRAQEPFYYDGKSSIGGCPAPRTDSAASHYSVAYVDVLDDAIEAILRATGAPRVDLVGISQGGVATRAYIRWRSGRGPGGQSRVRKHLLLESPSRGLSDLHSFSVALDKDKPPFMRQGEIAELSRSYPGWQGRSFISWLNDGYDAWTQAHGVAYAGVYGYGEGIINQATFAQALVSIQALLGGARPPVPASPAAFVPNAPFGIAPTDGLTTLEQALGFIDLSRFDLAGNLQEFLTDGDGALPTVTCSLAQGPFPSARFDAKFRGLHVDRGQPEEVIQFATHTRETIRRWMLEGREPRARVVSASARVVAATAHAPWLLVEYELAGGDGLSLQVRSEDELSYSLRKQIPALPDSPTVFAAPTFEGAHRLRFDAPTGQRVVTLDFYDTTGVVAEIGPLHLSSPSGGGTVEAAPVTTVTGSSTPTPWSAMISVASNAPGAEISYRLDVASGWTAWAPAGPIALSGLRPGTYELLVKSRHSANAAGELVEERDPVAVGIRVSGSGGVTVRYR
jgi:pimeloyl-ACP methyl ester carboxylesterase